MKDYNRLLQKIIDHGTRAPSRAGAVYKLSHEMLTFDLRNGFPAITGRKLQFPMVCGELACFLKGKTDILDFHQRGVRIWDANLQDANRRNGTPHNTDLGPIYGAQWRDFYGVDQLRTVIDKLKADRYDRRLLVSAWNPAQLEQMALPPCHLMWQLTTTDGEHLDLIFYMRSVDMALGFPFDIASYALILHLVANEVGMTPRKVSAVLADVHIYAQNIGGIEKYLDRPNHPLPKLHLTLEPGQAVEEFEPHHAHLIDYHYESPIQMEMAV